MWANRNYKQSNKILQVHFEPSSQASMIVGQILQSESTQDRQALSTDLLDELCDLAQMDIVNVKISAAKQYHKKRAGKVSMRQFGYYQPKTKYIFITNHTAVRGKPLAAKTFLNTLLHEWMHHYDTYKLGLNSIHSKGFYTRLHNLETLLRSTYE